MVTTKYTNDTKESREMGGIKGSLGTNGHDDARMEDAPETGARIEL